MRRLGGSLLAGLALSVLLGVPSAWAAFQDTCFGISYGTNALKRSVARNYAYSAHLEGYQWGGGCWNNNNVDDQPGDPPQTYSGGEGGDCSGFTFKAWYERSDQTLSSFMVHEAGKNIHGPYTAAKFKAGDGAPNVTVGKASTMFMDAFASTGHIGMIYAANVAYNTDDIIHAKGESFGTKILRETYRGQTAYSGVRRVNWLAECAPQCAGVT